MCLFSLFDRSPWIVFSLITDIGLDLDKEELISHIKFTENFKRRKTELPRSKAFTIDRRTITQRRFIHVHIIPFYLKVIMYVPILLMDANSSNPLMSPLSLYTTIKDQIYNILY